MWSFQMSGHMVELVVVTLLKSHSTGSRRKPLLLCLSDEEDSIETKLTKIVTKVYGGKGISLTPAAKRELKELEVLASQTTQSVWAKTQYSLRRCEEDGSTKRFHKVKISNLKVAAGAGFIVALTGTIMTMPGLPKVPASEKIDIDAHGNITGLFKKEGVPWWLSFILHPQIIKPLLWSGGQTTQLFLSPEGGSYPDRTFWLPPLLQR